MFKPTIEEKKILAEKVLGWEFKTISTEVFIFTQDYFYKPDGKVGQRMLNEI